MKNENFGVCIMANDDINVLPVLIILLLLFPLFSPNFIILTNSCLHSTVLFYDTKSIKIAIKHFSISVSCLLIPSGSATPNK